MFTRLEKTMGWSFQGVRLVGVFLTVDIGNALGEEPTGVVGEGGWNQGCFPCIFVLLTVLL